jgi:hypothetical protein
MAEPGCHEWPNKPKIATLILICVILATVVAEEGPGPPHDLTSMAQLGVHPKASQCSCFARQLSVCHWCMFQSCHAASAIVKAVGHAKTVSSCCSSLLYCNVQQPSSRHNEPIQGSSTIQCQMMSLSSVSNVDRECSLLQ